MFDSFKGFINEGTFQEYDYNNQYNEHKEELQSQYDKYTYICPSQKNHTPT